MVVEELKQLSDYDKSQIFLKNKNLITAVLKKLNLLNKMEDLYDIALIGFTKALNYYDESKGIKLSSYICICVEHEIFQELRSQNAQIRGSGIKPISLNQIVTKENDKELLEIISNGINIEKEICHKETINYLFSFVERLSVKEKTTIEHYFGINGKEKLTQMEISEILNIRQSQISRILNNALNKLKGMMERNDLYI